MSSCRAQHWSLTEFLEVCKTAFSQLSKWTATPYYPWASVLSCLFYFFFSVCRMPIPVSYASPCCCGCLCNIFNSRFFYWFEKKSGAGGRLVTYTGSLCFSLEEASSLSFRCLSVYVAVLEAPLVCYSPSLMFANSVGTEVWLWRECQRNQGRGRQTPGSRAAHVTSFAPTSAIIY